MNGGSKIKLTEENTEIIKVTSNLILQQDYKDKLIELTLICEPSDVFIPIINEPYDIFWIAKNKVNNEIIGYLKSTDLEQFNKDRNFVLLGGIVEEKGIQISGACNGKPDEYSNLATLLLNKIEDYANEMQYQYILLHAGTDREYLIGEGERKGLYIKNGYKKQKVFLLLTGGIDVIKFNEFYNEFIKGKYNNNLIIMDNAKFHKSKIVKENIEKSTNKIIYILPYNAKLNPIENLFSQIKNYVKNISPATYEDLKITIDKIIKNKVKKEHLKNYFKYLFIQAKEYIDTHK